MTRRCVSGIVPAAPACLFSFASCSSDSSSVRAIIRPARARHIAEWIQNPFYRTAVCGSDFGLSTRLLRARTMTLNEFMTKIIVEAMAERLKPLGFRKNKLAFVRDNGDTLSVVALQKSDVSNANFIRATINIGVYSKVLAAKLGDPPKTTSPWSCHYQQRIGMLLPIREDSWWEVTSLSQAETVGNDIAQCIVQFGLPKLDRMSSTAALEIGRAHV